MSLAVLARKTRATIDSRNARTNKNGQFSLNGPLAVNNNCGWRCSGTQSYNLSLPKNRQISNRSLLQRRVNGLHSSLQPTPTDADPNVYICHQQHTIAGKKKYMSSIDRTYSEYINNLISQNSHTDRKNVTAAEWTEKLKFAIPPTGKSCSNTCDNIMIYKGPFGGFESGEYIRTLNNCEEGILGICVVPNNSVGLPSCSC